MAEGGLLTGNFADKPFPLLLVEIKDASTSGVLIAQKGEIVKRVFFRSGEPVVCRSNVKKELLGEILCRRGVLSRAQLDEAILESKKESLDNFGQILVRKGFVSPQELYAKSKYQFISILFSLFAWEEGSYSFEEKDVESAIPTTLPRFHLQFTKLISEGIRLLKKEDLLDRLLGDPGQVVQRSLLEIPSEDLSFKGQEQALLEAMGSGKSIEALAASGVLDPFATKKIVYALSCLGTVVLQPAATAVDDAPVAAVLADIASEETLPPLEESSLSSMISEMQVDESDAGVPAEMPVTDEALEELSVSQIADEGLDVDELFTPSEETSGAASEFDDATEKIDAAVAQAGETLAEESVPSAEEVAPESLSDASAEAAATTGDEAMEETFSPAAIDEALISEAAGEAPGAPSAESLGREPAPDETGVPAAMDDDLASLEAVRASTAPEPSEEQEPEPLPTEEVATAAKAVEQEPEEVEAKREEEPPFTLKYRRSHRPARKGLPLLIGALLGGIALLSGGIAYYYSQRSDGAATKTPGASEQAQTLVPTGETKTAAQIIEELAAEGVGKEQVPGMETSKTGEPDQPTAPGSEGTIVSGPGIKIVVGSEEASQRGTASETAGPPAAPSGSEAGAAAESAKADAETEAPVAAATDTAPTKPEPSEESTAETVAVAKAVPSEGSKPPTGAAVTVPKEAASEAVTAEPAPAAPPGEEKSPPAVPAEAPEQKTVTAKVEAPAEPAPAAPPGEEKRPPAVPAEAPEQKAVTAKVEAPAVPPTSAKPAETVAKSVALPVKPLQDWGTYYDKGLASFKDGNLKTAFATWADVIRAAPREAFSIQIELTSYLSYASKDLEAALPNEKVFIVLTALNDKPVYKVLCGIYPDEETAEKALAGLSPYLKAQKPLVVSLVRLKEKLAKYQR